MLLINLYENNESVNVISIDIDDGNVEGYTVEISAVQVDNWLSRNKIEKYKLYEYLTNINKITFLNNINVEHKGVGTGNNLMNAFIEESGKQYSEAIVLVADSGEEQDEGFNLVEWYESFGFEVISNTSGGELMVLIF